MRLSASYRNLRVYGCMATGITWFFALAGVMLLTNRPEPSITTAAVSASSEFKSIGPSVVRNGGDASQFIQRSKQTSHQSTEFRIPRQLEIPRFPHAQLLESNGDESTHQVINLCQYQTAYRDNYRTHHPRQYGLGGEFGDPIDTGVGPQSPRGSCNPGCVPWQAFSSSQYVEPARQPFVPEYRVRVGDQILFIYHVTRFETAHPYRIGVGDVISIDSDSHDELNKTDIQVLPDGTISLSPLQTVPAAGKTFSQLKRTLEFELSAAGIRDPRVTVLPVTVNLPNQDLRDAVDGRQGIGGQRLEVQVTWDGCVRLPKMDDVPVVGLTLAEVSYEVNSRLTALVEGIQVTPILSQSAPAFVYVLGEVTEQGQLPAQRPMTALQAITQAGGFLPGANMRDVIVLRRTEDWRLIATRLNLWQAGFGKGLPYEDVWLHDGDIVIVPRLRIERFAELTQLYFTRSLYRIIPNQGFTLAFTSDATIF